MILHAVFYGYVVSDSLPAKSSGWVLLLWASGNLVRLKKCLSSICLAPAGCVRSKRGRKEKGEKKGGRGDRARYARCDDHVTDSTRRPTSIVRRIEKDFILGPTFIPNRYHHARIVVPTPHASCSYEQRGQCRHWHWHKHERRQEEATAISGKFFHLHLFSLLGSSASVGLLFHRPVWRPPSRPQPLPAARPATATVVASASHMGGAAIWAVHCRSESAGAHPRPADHVEVPAGISGRWFGPIPRCVQLDDGIRCPCGKTSTRRFTNRPPRSVHRSAALRCHFVGACCIAQIQLSQSDPIQVA